MTYRRICQSYEMSNRPITLLLTHSLTHSIQQSPYSEANRFSASQEIPHVLWKPNVHYRIHKCPPPFLILSQLDPVHTTTSHFLKIHLCIILPSTPGCTKWSLSLRFPYQNLLQVSPLHHTCYMSHPSIVFVLQCFKLSFLLAIPAVCPVAQHGDDVVN